MYLLSIYETKQKYLLIKGEDNFFRFNLPIRYNMGIGIAPLNSMNIYYAINIMTRN